VNILFSVVVLSVVDQPGFAVFCAFGSIKGRTGPGGGGIKEWRNTVAFMFCCSKKYQF
jgi:hypothetical protein